MPNEEQSEESSHEIRQLKQRRGQLKAHLTRFAAFLSTQVAITSTQELITRVEKMELIFTEFEQVQSQLESLDAKEMSVREELENKFYKNIAAAKTMVSEFQYRLTAMSNNSDTTTSNSADASEQFGNASQVIASLESTNANYSIAWNLLKERFQNKRLIINNHIKAMFEIASLDKESFTSLRNLVDNILQNMRAVNALELPTDGWDTLIIYLTNTKLDNCTRKEWESSIKSNTLPTLKQFLEFLIEKCSHLEALEVSNKQFSMPIKNNTNTYQWKKAQSYGVVQKINEITAMSCFYCNKSHAIYVCEEFLKKSLDDKYKEIQRLKLCINCLKPGHHRADCTLGNCRKCRSKHNTILHPVENQTTTNKNTITLSNHSSVNQDTNTLECLDQTASITSYFACKEKLVLLSTAIVYIKDTYGKTHQCRALLDSGSQSNFITSTLVEKLQLREIPINVSITGIAHESINAMRRVNTTISSMQTNYTVDLTFLVLPQITDRIPTVPFNLHKLKIPDYIQLADPHLNEPNEIEILIGASIFYHLLCNNQILLGDNQPLLQKTLLGWILSGVLDGSIKTKQPKTMCNLSLNQQLTKFWELEEVQPKRLFSLEEQYCESYFKETTTRDETGRFIVKLPCNDLIKKLGESKPKALKRLEATEKRFQRDQSYNQLYKDFMKEYLKMGHMSFISSDINNSDFAFYFPHHGVRKDDSTTTKLRVVFDGSAATDSGISLNNCLRVGPTIQDDLFDIVLRFRTHPYVITADITKMYRMILVHPDHRHLQRVFWRSNEEEPISIFTLNTVSYGTASAPFLAVRCLHELAYQHVEQFPEACNIILKDFYIDDLITGTDSIESAIRLKNEIVKIFDSAGFELRKWSSNSSQLLNSIEENSKLISNEKRKTKILGLIWDSINDTFQYLITQPTYQSRYTKRQILSTIAQLFDPLGLIGPAIIKAKILMQKLWQCQVNWDQRIPEELHSMWESFITKIQTINSITIPRFVICQFSRNFELHGFSDASEAAYGCCIYVRSINTTHQYSVNLLCAKSRVAPLKTITIPKLELCAALLLARVINKVRKALNIKIDKQYLWTDSTIVLSWLSTQPCYLQTFVANRIIEITELTSILEWHHVTTDQNPADIISRGLNPEQLQLQSLWWYGPDFLNNNLPIIYNHSIIESPEIPEMKQSTRVLISIVDNLQLFEKYSSLHKLHRVIAYILRFKTNALVKFTKLQPFTGMLSVKELTQAMTCIVKVVQMQEFATEINLLQENKQLQSSSKLLNLHPFLDHNEILRVGGRIKHSQVSYNQKHPIIIPAKHKFTELLIQQKHLQNLHAGTQTLLAIIRLDFWPLSGKSIIKKILRRCIRCFRAKPTPMHQLMGELPADRCTVLRPFLKCGVDYGGPFMIKDGILRRANVIKAYMCVFICLSTKAIHIELVQYLSTEAFLNALKRFISRRGKPSDIFSDNGSNFIGASNEFQKFNELMSNKSHQHRVTEWLHQDNISWHFIPANSPHMGGIWEAAIKSIKYHLKRVVGNANLTFDEMNTLLSQIEACLNSRPLTPISNDPLDFSPLTPSHFLIGDSLSALPQRDITNENDSRLKRYLLIQQMVQQFWKRWSLEYLSSLQTRTRWKTLKPEQIQPGTLVVIKEDNTPPLNWSMARVLECHPGADNITRVVSLKTPSGTILKRAITKICLLPID